MCYKVVDCRERMVDEIWKLTTDMAESRVRLTRVRGIGGGPGVPGGRSHDVTGGGAATRTGRSGEASERLNFTTRVDAIFRLFQREVGAAVKDQGWDGKDDTDETRLQWSFAGALLYAVTVTTTIGIPTDFTKLDHNSLKLLRRVEQKALIFDIYCGVYCGVVMYFKIRVT